MLALTSEPGQLISIADDVVIVNDGKKLVITTGEITIVLKVGQRSPSRQRYDVAIDAPRYMRIDREAIVETGKDANHDALAVS